MYCQTKNKTATLGDRGNLSDSGRGREDTRKGNEAMSVQQSSPICVRERTTQTDKEFVYVH